MIMVKYAFIKILILCSIIGCLIQITGCRTSKIPPDPIIQAKVVVLSDSKIKIEIVNVTNYKLCNLKLKVDQNNSIKNIGSIVNTNIGLIEPKGNYSYILQFRTKEKMEQIQAYRLWVEGYYRSVSKNNHFISDFGRIDSLYYE